MSRLTPPVGPGDHILGDPGALVTLVEYGDYECPHCARAHAIVHEVMRRVGRDLRFVYRHFPLSQVHPHALREAEAAEAAGTQGKFWPMHDTLFENQDAVELEDLIGYAVIVGLDAVRIADDLAEHTHLERVKSDFQSGARSGVNGTPTFFIDGVRFDESWDADTLTEALQEAIRAKR